MNTNLKLSVNKIQLSNLEYSMQREVLCVGSNGCYASTTIVGCNTRKYHGLYVCPQPELGQDNYVLLSQMQETIVQQEQEFNLGVARYGDIYEPKGHKYLEIFSMEPHPCWYYRVGGVLLKKEMIMHKEQNRLLLRYTLEKAHSKTTIKLRPFCAFRNVHKLTSCNSAANKQVQILADGIKVRMYDSFSDLFIQGGNKIRFEENAEWYYGVSYLMEEQRGYQSKEDLLTPGYFIAELVVGKPLYISIGAESLNEKSSVAKMFEQAIALKKPVNSLVSCLESAAEDFVVQRRNRTQIMAGYPWFGSWGRDTFISLPGLTLSTKKFKEAEAVLESMLEDKKGGLFPNIGYGKEAAYNSVDAPLWFIWAVQQYAISTGKAKETWKKFGDSVKDVIECYANGSNNGIYRADSGLIYAFQEGRALTWMDAVVNGNPVTQRAGAAVEINALWYNALMYALESAKATKTMADKAFISKWSELADKFPSQFKEAFWDKSRGYLSDVVLNESEKDWSFRPNQIIAASLPYKAVSDKICQLVVEKVKQVLLTPRGLRTLSPFDSKYEGVCEGDQATRDASYHQGIVWPWLLEHFAKAYIEVYGPTSLPFLSKMLEDFEGSVSELCIGTVAEIYDGNPPHKARGSVSQAWSVAALLRIKEMLQI